MEGLDARFLISFLLILGNAFFVAAEYALVSSRKARIDALAKKGNRTAKRVQGALANVSNYVAGSQVAITMFGIGVGSVTEPFITSLISSMIGTNLDRSISYGVSIILVTYIMTVVGELVPKYVTLAQPERLALFTFPALSLFITLLKPLIWLIERSGNGIVRIFGIKATETESIRREELLLLMKSGSVEGLTDRQHTQFVSRTMQLDKLTADDVMVHRLDISWLDLSLDDDATHEALSQMRHTRIPVCRGDIDDIAGILYINDYVRGLTDPKATIESMLRPVVVCPESLTLDRIVALMREEKTQILIVIDEYGGTSGLVTLEDVVEEIFGELEDSLEHERSPIEFHAGGRVSVRADVRFDELVSELVERTGLELADDPETNTLATVMVEALGRMPRIGDVVDTAVGQLRVENMARRRVTRISLMVADEIAAKLA